MKIQDVDLLFVAIAGPGWVWLLLSDLQGPRFLTQYGFLAGIVVIVNFIYGIVALRSTGRAMCVAAAGFFGAWFALFVGFGVGISGASEFLAVLCMIATYLVATVGCVLFIRSKIPRDH